MYNPQQLRNRLNALTTTFADAMVQLLGDALDLTSKKYAPGPSKKGKKARTAPAKAPVKVKVVRAKRLSPADMIARAYTESGKTVDKSLTKVKTPKKPRSNQKYVSPPTTTGKIAVLTKHPMNGFYEMVLPDGRVWGATRARDLRRKAAQKGVAFEDRV